jgi:chromatin assembly factor 1 subunit A
MSEQSSSNTHSSKKRSHDEAEGVVASEASIEKSNDEQLQPPISPLIPQSLPQPDRQASPAISIQSSALFDAKIITPTALQAVPSAVTGPGGAKKQKLSFAQKEIDRALRESEKEESERRKAEELQRKEQEKLARDQEKRRKEEVKEAAKRQREVEKAEKLKAKEAEKQAKDEAKQKKEEEKKKKERAQLRLGSFFQKPAGMETTEESSHTTSRRSSVVSFGGLDDAGKEAATKSSPQKKTDARSGFLPFFVPLHAELAPTNRFGQDSNISHIAVSRLDGWMAEEHDLHTGDVVARFKSRKRKRCQQLGSTVKEIVESIQGTSTSPIDLTGEGAPTQLSHVPYKILSFKEDVRPPYMGTYTRAVRPESALKLSRCPFTKQLPLTNYDYDSEAEWEPPNEDDEDLESGDDESDMGEEGEEDMDEFLDDEDDLGKRKLVMGEMAPISSGLCWNKTNDEKGSLEEYRMQTLSDEHVFPMNPFSSTYWLKAQPISKQAAMQPPRLPLSSLNPNRSLSMTPPPVKGEGDETAEPSCQQSAPLPLRATAKITKPLKLAPDEVLLAFKQAVEGSDLTKVGLIEILKKQ